MRSRDPSGPIRGQYYLARSLAVPGLVIHSQPEQKSGYTLTEAGTSWLRAGMVRGSLNYYTDLVRH